MVGGGGGKNPIFLQGLPKVVKIGQNWLAAFRQLGSGGGGGDPPQLYPSLPTTAECRTSVQTTRALTVNAISAIKAHT